jgi:hypothetical protein
LLPYQTPGDVHVGLVDFDRVVKGNTATQLLVTAEHLDRRKTRVVAEALESLGFNTTVVERAFDEHFRPRDDEPTIALAGFDRVEPRQQLGVGRFARVIDVGLGAGPVQYLDMVVHTFPAPMSPEDTFRSGTKTSRELPTAYQDEIARQVQEGGDERVARCGLLEVAGVTVGAAFGGALASTLAIGDLLRLLHDGQDFSVISVDLRAPDGIHAVTNTAPGEYPTPSFTPAR